MTREIRNTEETFQEELEALFHQHRPLVYRTAYHVTGERADAEDVAQTVFMKLLRTRPPEDFDQNPRGYLYRAASNEAIEVVRARKRRQPAEVDVEEMDSVAAPTDPALDDEILSLRAAIATMRPDFVQTLHLHYEGCTSQEIAALLGKTPLSVRIVLWRAKRELRQQLLPKENHRETQGQGHRNPPDSGTMLAD